MSVNPAVRFKEIFIGDSKNFRFFQFDRASSLLYGLFFLAISIYDFIAGNELKWFEQASVWAGLAIILLFIIFTDKPNKKQRRNGNIIILIFNLFVFVAIILVANLFRGISMDIIMYQFKVACWENMFFGIVVPTILTEILYVLTDESKVKTRLFTTLIIIILSSIGFGVAHWKVYGTDVRLLARLGGLGLIFIGLAWTGLPSLSITAHFTNNLLAV